MNVERLEKIRDILRDEAKLEAEMKFRFDMEVWLKDLNSCGTVGCIAGLACVVGDKEGWHSPYRDVYGKAEFFLGLTYRESRRLFFAKEAEIPMFRITRNRAADAIDNLIETGDPHWERIE